MLFDEKMVIMKKVIYNTCTCITCFAQIQGLPWLATPKEICFALAWNKLYAKILKVYIYIHVKHWWFFFLSLFYIHKSLQYSVIKHGLLHPKFRASHASMNQNQGESWGNHFLIQRYIKLIHSMTLSLPFNFQNIKRGLSVRKES